MFEAPGAGKTCTPASIEASFQVVGGVLKVGTQCFCFKITGHREWERLLQSRIADFVVAPVASVDTDSDAVRAGGFTKSTTEFSSFIIQPKFSIRMVMSRSPAYSISSSKAVFNSAESGVSERGRGRTQRIPSKAAASIDAL